MRIVKAQLYNSLKNWSTWIILAVFMFGQVGNLIDKENVKMSLFERNLIFFRIGNTGLCVLIFTIIVIGKIIKNNYIKNIKALYEKKERIVVVNTVVSSIYIIFLYAVNFIIDIFFYFMQKQPMGTAKEFGELLSYIPIFLCVAMFASIVMLIVKSTLIGYICGFAFLFGKDLFFSQMKIDDNYIVATIVAVVMFFILYVVNLLIAKKVYRVI